MKHRHIASACVCASLVASAVGLAVWPRALIAQQQQNNTWADVVCQAETRVYGQYKDSRGKIHWVDMQWNPQASDWEILESGSHVEGAFGKEGQHGVRAWWLSIGHLWGTDQDDEELYHDEWDIHYEHARHHANNLYSGQCGFAQF